MRKILIPVLIGLSIATWAQVPSITSFLPVSAPAGATVTITGKNFSATATDNIVYFGATRAKVTSAKSDQLVVAVPSGATYQPISVTTRGLTAVSNTQFIPTPGSTSNLSENSFVPFGPLAAGGVPLGIFLNDLDGDGIADVIVENGDPFNVIKNASTPAKTAFNSAIAFAEGEDFIVPGDFDGDGKIDIIGEAEPDNMEIDVFLNSGVISKLGDNVPSTYVSSVDNINILTGDLDGDGLPEVIMGSVSQDAIVIYINNAGKLNYSNILTLTIDDDDDSGPVTMSDIDGDGRPDLMVPNSGSSTISIFKNNSSPGKFSFSSGVDVPVGNHPLSIVTGDIDGDGKQDLVTVNAGNITIVQNHAATGSINIDGFDNIVTFSFGYNPTAAALGDLTGDGLPDFAFLTDRNIMTLIPNSLTPGPIPDDPFGDGTLDITTTGKLTSSIAIGDLNNDGKADIAVGNGQDNTVTIFMNADSTQANTPGDLTVYHGISPDGNGKNDTWFIPNINTLPTTQSNHVQIFNRWGDAVFEGDNYDNTTVVFTGHNKSGGELPAGVYFYKIAFASGKKTLSGYLSIKR